MNYKGIILAGGKGSRLSPITKSINKHLLPLHNKPLIYYSLSVLFLSKIREILIISSEKDIVKFKNLLGNGERYGVKFFYKIQKKPSGIPEGLLIGKDFLKNSGAALILGDNLFYGHQLTKKFNLAKKNNKNCTIFLYPVDNPNDYGVLEIDKNNRIKSIREKPNVTNSKLAITGFYLFDKKAVQYAKKLKPSKRKEIEIISLIKKYYSQKQLKFEFLGRGSTWIDAGTFENLDKAAMYVKSVENIQGHKIACLEEIALLNKWIKKKDLLKSISFYGNCEYSKYLKNIMKN